MKFLFLLFLLNVMSCTSRNLDSCGRYDILYFVLPFNHTKPPYQYFDYPQGLFIIDTSDLYVKAGEKFWIEEFYYNNSDSDISEISLVQPDFCLFFYLKYSKPTFYWREVNFSNRNIKYYKYKKLNEISDYSRLDKLVEKLNKIDKGYLLTQNPYSSFLEISINQNKDSKPFEVIRSKNYIKTSFQVFLKNPGLYKLQYNHGFLNQVIEKYIIVE